MNTAGIMLIEGSQTQKSMYCLSIHLYEAFERAKVTYCYRSHKVIASGVGVGGRKRGVRENVLNLDKTVGYTGVILCQNSLSCKLKICTNTECKLYNESYCETSQDL